MAVGVAVINFRAPDIPRKPDGSDAFQGGPLVAALNELSPLRWDIRHISDLPVLPDGWPHDDEEWHPSDYPAWLERSGVMPLLRSGVVNVVMAWCDRRGGFAEHVTRGVGPEPGQPWGQLWQSTRWYVPLPDVGRLYTVLGLNTERGLAEALHSVGHWLEDAARHRAPTTYYRWCGWDHFYRLYRSSDPIPPFTWDRREAAGVVHFPYRCRKAYDYEGPGSDEWGSSHLGYLRAWLGRMTREHPDYWFAAVGGAVE